MVSIQQNLAEGRASRIAGNFFTHSGHVPITLLILEALLAPAGYFAKPDAYLLLAAGFAQAWLIGSADYQGRPKPFLGNLVGPLVYSLAEVALEGVQFFQQWHHQAYWGYALLFAALHWSQQRFHRGMAVLVLTENVLRATVPLVMYALFEVRASDGRKMFSAFFDDSAHSFLTIVLLLLGTLLGFADISLRRSLTTVRRLAQRLHQYSEWSFGRGILDRAIEDENTLALQRVQRAVAFMDIRGFTAWSERQTPEAVVTMLNGFYRSAERALQNDQPIKYKYTADEVMVVFADAKEAARGGQAMLTAAEKYLGPFGLGAGAGVHWGSVVEGVLGGDRSRAYDFIGDTVNTAQRLCDAARPSELLASEAACAAAGAAVTTWREISAKGKSGLLRAGALICTVPNAA